MIRGKSHLEYKDYDKIVALYDTYFAVTAPYQGANYENNEENLFSFSLNSYLIFYIDMHRFSGDARWLDLIQDTCNHILDNTDEAREGRGEITLTPLEDPGVDTNYFQAPYPYQLNGTPVKGWSSFDGSPRPRLRVQVLQDGQICAALCSVADYILENSLTGYTALANTLLAHCRLVIDSHNNSFRYGNMYDGEVVQGSYYYPERLNGTDSVYGTPLAYNHAGGVCKAMLICHKYLPNSEYVNKVTAFLGFTKDTRVNVVGENRFEWQYVISNPSAEDINHGSYSLDMIYTAYKQGIGGVTHSDMVKYTNSILYAERGGLNDPAEKVDGSGDLPAGEKFNVGQMAYLAEFNRDILYFGRDLAGINYIAKYASHFAAHAALLNALEPWEK